MLHVPSEYSDYLYVAPRKTELCKMLQDRMRDLTGRELKMNVSNGISYRMEKKNFSIIFAQMQGNETSVKIYSTVRYLPTRHHPHHHHRWRFGVFEHFVTKEPPPAPLTFSMPCGHSDAGTLRSTASRPQTSAKSSDCVPQPVCIALGRARRFIATADVQNCLHTFCLHTISVNSNKFVFTRPLT